MTTTTLDAGRAAVLADIEADAKANPCVVCGKPAAWAVGWLAPTAADACEETGDHRRACSAACAYRVRK